MCAAENPEEDRPVLVSACLLGLKTRYDGGDCRRQTVVDRLRGKLFIPICPEQLGGLSTPRCPAEINRGDGRDVLDGEARVVRRDGVDVTEEYLRGAEQVLELVGLSGAGRAILKEGSPACGVTRLKRRGADVKGCGVAAAMLKEEGVRVAGIE